MKYIYIVFVLISVGVSFTRCDDNQNFEQLCKSRDNVIGCVRNFFAKHAMCKVVRRADNKPVYRESHNCYMPKINLTVITTQVNLKNLNGSIEEFYINKDTGNLVMTVNFEGIILDSPVTYFRIGQRGLEPKVLTDYANGTYPAVLTAVIPANRKITVETLKNSAVDAYLPQGNVKFYIGPNVTESEDPVVTSVVKGLAADVPTAVQEIFLTESGSFFLAYLQKYICDFGVPLTQ